MIKFWTFIFCLLLLGCTTTAPLPPLIDGEIPYRLNSGIYRDTKGQAHVITAEKPRWCVSEAYLYESVSNVKPDSEINQNNYMKYTVIGVGLLVSALVLKRIFNK